MRLPAVLRVPHAKWFHKIEPLWGLGMTSLTADGVQPVWLDALVRSLEKHEFCMGKRVLDIGNCGPDHASITDMIQTHFGAEVDAADGTSDALPLLEKNSYDLVLVNRLMDRDGSPGMDVIAKVLEGHPELPTMLITNFEEHQQAAVAAGTVPGFGKRAIGAPETIETLAKYLA